MTREVSMFHRIWLTGSVALAFLLGTLVLAAPAQAYVQNCDKYAAGTQAYAECMVRAEDREAAPILPPAQEVDLAPTVIEESSTVAWQLALAGLVGAAVAIGGTVGLSRLGQRERVTAH